MNTILGISAFYHDSAACLLRDGDIVAAAQEERFTRKKADARLPVNAIRFCLQSAGIDIGAVDFVTFYDKPLLKFERILETYLGLAPAGFGQFLKAGPLWMKEKLFTAAQIRTGLMPSQRMADDDVTTALAPKRRAELLYAEHHESHAASAFFPSPFEEAAILTMDGVGEWSTASIGMGRGNDLELITDLVWPDSLGLLYSAFTYYTGFKVNSGEYKVMGLAPYGEPKYVDVIYRELMDLRPDGSFRLNQRYFNYLSGFTMTTSAFDDLFGGPPRKPESPLTQREMDLARSVQEVCEDVMLKMAHSAHRLTGSKHLVMAGGVALNCVGNGRILREGPFERLWIQPAAGDAGGALGAALLTWHRHLKQPRTVGPRDSMKGGYLGPAYEPDAILDELSPLGAVGKRLDREALLERVADDLASEKVVGWMNGRMEFGPRALGARSILGDPRSARMQQVMNLKIKFRESFRPFAPSVLEEHVADWFELDSDSPYMLLVAPVKRERCHAMSDDDNALWGIEKLNVPRSEIPAITHVDYSARVQTVSKETNPEYHALIARFGEKTGCPVLVNTSFNVRGEPIVCSPLDAYRCFMRTDMDTLVIWPFVFAKEDQPDWREESDWREQLPLD